MPAPLTALRTAAPGVALCALVAASATALAALERCVTGRAWLEPLVLAILLGSAIRTMRPPSPRYAPGIDASARLLLEIAVALLGLSVDAHALLGSGAMLLVAIAAVVLAAIATSYAIARLFGLSPRLATLIACGNSICGNSAIAAVAPVIGAAGTDVAAAISFTALFGVALVLLMPAAALMLHVGAARYGIFAGLTVYAVPQVLAATAPLGSVAVQIGTVVKLVRVMMLGPVVAALSWREGRYAQVGRTHLLPWFIVAFLALAAWRSTGAVPDMLLAHASSAANVLTIVSMAALGLGTDLRSVARAGTAVTAVVALSLASLAGWAVLSIRLLGLG